jgi:hypothetical protein
VPSPATYLLPKWRLFMKCCGLALCLVTLSNGFGALAANYPISGAWTVAPSNSRQIVDVRRACQAFRRKEDLEAKGSAGRLVVFWGEESTWYNRHGTRVCRNISNKATDKSSFHVVDVCRNETGHTQQKSYTLKRLNRLQVFITPSDSASSTYELIGCPS